MRHIITVRKQGQPTVYYISKRGLRCYDARNVAIYRTASAALEDLQHLARDMKDFCLSVEVLPANVRNVAAAILAARPLDRMSAAS